MNVSGIMASELRMGKRIGLRPHFEHWQKSGSAYYTYQNDHLGTPMKLLNQSGVVVWSATYDAFGRATVDAASTVKNNLRFPGQYEDAETGLHYNWNRYYDPTGGRYTTSDPISVNGGLNLYLYAAGSPNSFADPLGLIPNCKKIWQGPLHYIRFGSKTIDASTSTEWDWDFKPGTKSEADTEGPKPSGRNQNIPVCIKLVAGKATLRISEITRQVGTITEIWGYDTLSACEECTGCPITCDYHVIPWVEEVPQTKPLDEKITTKITRYDFDIGVTKCLGKK